MNQKSSKIIAYESALMIFVAILFMNFMSLIKIYNIPLSFKILKTYSKLEQYFIVGIVCIICCFILSFFAPKKKVKSINYDLRDEAVDYTIMFIYTIGSFLLLIYLY
jgi:hypothetical protein